MNGTTHLRAPGACSEEELRAFERRVREGFEGSDEHLPDRIRAAERLAFHRASDRLVAIAGLKRPDAVDRDRLFRKARAAVDPADYEFDLGWVYVVPAHRGKRTARSLCRQLLDCVPNSPVFSTTRPTNAVMIDLLFDLDFERVGRPFPHRTERLALFVRIGR